MGKPSDGSPSGISAPRLLLLLDRLAEAVHGQHRTRAMQRQCIEHHRPKFADIAGKMIIRQQGEQFVRRLWGRLPDRGSRFIDEVLQEQPDVLLALAQRRHFNLVDRQAEEEVGAELVLTHHLGQVAVGRANNPRVAWTCDVGTQRVVHVLLQQAQQLHLRGQSARRATGRRR